jgi:hypothetical protein
MLIHTHQISLNHSQRPNLRNYLLPVIPFCSQFRDFTVNRIQRIPKLLNLRMEVASVRHPSLWNKMFFIFCKPKFRSSALRQCFACDYWISVEFRVKICELAPPFNNASFELSVCCIQGFDVVEESCHHLPIFGVFGLQFVVDALHGRVIVFGKEELVLRVHQS